MKCYNSLFCEKCIDEYYVYKGKCYQDNCPSTTFISTFISPSQCYSIFYFKFFQIKLIFLIKKKYIIQPKLLYKYYIYCNIVKIECKANCDACSSYESECSQCSSGYFLLSGNCLSECPTTYFEDSSSSIKKCSSNLTLSIYYYT